VGQGRSHGRTVGLVPTMGALHAGHASLMKAARAGTDFVVVSLFVNPTQFGPSEDLDRYPRTWGEDLRLCAAEGVDLVFAPDASVMYPLDFHTYVEVHDLQSVLCGRTRPTHFRGVATVVLKLLNIVGPNIAYFGQKDAQQVRLLEQMVQDLNVPVQIFTCPIVRAPDGLALSSRNQYLSPEQRLHATALYQALEEARGQVESGERTAELVTRTIRQHMDATPGARVDYVAVVDYATLQPVQRLQGKVLVALAVYFGETRLIDNMILEL
jgi:pantoate--beta-alanine ligase